MGYFTEEYKEEAFKFINNKMSYISTIDYISYGGDGEDYTEEFISDRIDEAAYEMGAEWGKCGASKCVFKFDQYPDIVFKIPFEGSISSYYDDEEDEYFLDEDVSYFQYAGDENKRTWDYCETEARNYEKAIESGVEKVFAPTEYLGMTKFDIPVYVSENIESKNSMYSVNPSNDSIKTAKSMSESCGYWSIPDRFLALYIDSYGEEEASNLISFLKDNQIYDLHTANWKLDSNGNIRIIDYSSWND